MRISDWSSDVCSSDLVPPELLPVYAKGYGWLDASIGYDITKQITVTIEGSNLLQRREFPYYGSPTRPNGRPIDDRQIMAGLRFQLYSESGGRRSVYRHTARVLALFQREVERLVGQEWVRSL